MAHTPVVRRRIRREDCHVVYEDGRAEIWFDPNRRVGENGMFGGPSIIVVECVLNNHQERKRWDLFGFEENGIRHHDHDHPDDLDDPDHTLYLEDGEDPIEQALEYIERPGFLCRELDKAGYEDFAKHVFEVRGEFRKTSTPIRQILGKHPVGQRSSARLAEMVG